MIGIPWILLAIVWILGALRHKQTVRRESLGERVFQITGGLVASYLLFTHPAHAKSAIRETTGFVLCVAGVGVAIWARVLLGTNWSGMVTLKEGHELIRRGPYAFVRHPIYSGILLAMLGTAVYYAHWQCFAGVAVAFVTWWKKSRIEESFMVDFFGDRYRRYQREVRALIPGVL